ncbi:FecR family protein [Aquimarina sp. 2201CG14-23]|uniref:FecR family protein n=1 Tax=Aquimarina mycalae TaxID=3040073 RepID=UPI002477EB65|nr:FecR family protein [Aquimarina sp. 2201CG14-23]MDH7444398.1 FecR family protein [Aquimarina sp. 2201CG14-23]
MDKEYLIKKWLADDLTDAELELFKKLDDYKMHTKVIEGAQYFKASDVSEIGEIKDLYAKMESTTNLVSENTHWYIPLLKIASVFVVILGISFFYFFQRDSTFQTLANQKLTVELPDASEVEVNSKSEIIFNKSTWDNKREVNLSGEAFFKVKKGSAFDVITKDGRITVLGTQFNVKNRENYFEVKCFEGLVRVEHESYAKSLSAGNTMRIIDGKITFETVDLDRPQWLSNISSFKSVPFYAVVKEFERQYDVVVVMENIDTKRLFTGGFVHNNLEDGLKSITLPLDLIYNIETSNRITLRNTK